MRKTPFILAAGVIAALVLTNVIEIRFHWEKLADIPQVLGAAAKDGSAYEKIRASVVTAKRSAEKWFIKDDKQRLEVALGYVEQDSSRLRRLVEAESASPEKLAAQANLLAASLARLQEESQAVSIEDLASFKDKLSLALSAAQETNYEAVKEKLTQVRQAIEAQIGLFP